MRRRDFLLSLPLAALMPQLRAAAQLKITGIRIVHLKGPSRNRQDGSGVGSRHRDYMAHRRRIDRRDSNRPGTFRHRRGSTPVQLEAAESQLVGKDPFSVEQLAGPLRYYAGGSPRSSLSIGNCPVGPYRQGRRSTPLQNLGRGQRARTRLCQHDPAFDPRRKGSYGGELKSEGWKAIKLRAHYSTLREDVQLVEAVRKAVGDDMEIMVDANQAQSFDVAAGRGVGFPPRA